MYLQGMLHWGHSHMSMRTRHQHPALILKEWPQCGFLKTKKCIKNSNTANCIFTKWMLHRSHQSILSVVLRMSHYCWILIFHTLNSFRTVWTGTNIQNKRTSWNVTGFLTFLIHQLSIFLLGRRWQYAGLQILMDGRVAYAGTDAVTHRDL